MPGTQEDTSANGRLCSVTRPHHAVGTRGWYPPELVRVDRAWCARVVGACLEGRVATGATHVTDALDQPARGQCGIAKYP